jgi:hypothetical protein
VVVGGELTLENADLTWSEAAKFYEAPFQMKSNGGTLVIDDFGRQRVAPQDLLNRWIVPLERRVDYLALHTGKKIEVPFEQLVVFSTNLGRERPGGPGVSTTHGLSRARRTAHTRGVHVDLQIPGGQAWDHCRATGVWTTFWRVPDGAPADEGLRAARHSRPGHRHL